MILVVGTKRSGTSMWMQVLRAAGVPIIGDAFPLNWEASIGQANPQGFFESLFREGIYYRTNPHPQTGAFLRPKDASGHAVKVFPGGLVRTDLAYVEQVIGTIRPWRDYVASAHRLFALEGTHQVARPGTSKSPGGLEARLPHWAVWWLENFQLVRDILTRGHTATLHSYESVLQEPGRIVGAVLEWLDTETDASAGISAVRAGRAEALPWPDGESEPPSDFIPVFDELYTTIHLGRPVSRELLDAMNRTFLRFSDEFAVDGSEL